MTTKARRSNCKALAGACQVRIAGRVYPFFGVADVSRDYLAAIRALDAGASKMPPCEILDPAGRVVGQVSYNGRVWAIASHDIEPVLVFDPRRSEPAAARRATLYVLGS